MQKFKAMVMKKQPVDEKAHLIDTIKKQIEFMDREFLSEDDTPYLFEMAKIKNRFEMYLKSDIKQLFNLYEFLLERNYNNLSNASPDKFTLELDVLLNSIRSLIWKFQPLEFCQYIHTCQKNTINLFIQDSELNAEATKVPIDTTHDKVNVAETLATAFSNVKITANTFWSSAKSNLPSSPGFRSTIIIDVKQNVDNAQQYSNAYRQNIQYKIDVLSDRKLWLAGLDSYIEEEQKKLKSEREADNAQGYELYFDKQDNLLQWQNYYSYSLRENVGKQEQYLNENNIVEQEEQEKEYKEYLVELEKYQKQYDANQITSQQDDTQENNQVPTNEEEQMARKSISINLKSASMRFSMQQATEIKQQFSPS